MTKFSGKYTEGTTENINWLVEAKTRVKKIWILKL